MADTDNQDGDHRTDAPPPDKSQNRPDGDQNRPGSAERVRAKTTKTRSSREEKLAAALRANLRRRKKRPGKMRDEKPGD